MSNTGQQASAKWQLQVQPDEQTELENWMIEERERAHCPELGLKRARIKNKKTQQEMADIMHLSRRAYQLHESGKRPIPSDAMVKLAAFFDADLHEVFTGERYPVTNSEKEKNAKFAISTFVKLLGAFQKENMTMKEAEQITIHYLRFNQPGDDPKGEDLDDSIRAITGNKFVRGGPSPTGWEGSNLE